MTYKSNINPQERGFYFAASGDDQFSGETIETPKQTMQAAIDAAASLIPPPSPVDIALVTVAQGGSFNNGFVLEDAIQFIGTNVTINANQANVVTMASFLNCEITTLTNAFIGGICYQFDGKIQVGVDTKFLTVLGDNGIGFNMTGVCRNLFVNISQLALRGLNATGIIVTSDCSTVDDFQFNTVTLGEEGCTFFNYNPVDKSNTINVNVSTIRGPSVSTGTAFIIDNGILVVELGISNTPTFLVMDNESELTMRAQKIKGSTTLNGLANCNITALSLYLGNIVVNDTAGLFIETLTFSGNITTGPSTNSIIHTGFMEGELINSGLLFFDCDLFRGNITVNEGATLNCNITEHIGTLTNNGTINGTINGVTFGTYLDDYDRFLVGDAGAIVTSETGNILIASN